MDPLVANLESLPPELVIPIMLKLSVNDIRRLCRVSRYLSSFCQDWRFWAEKAFQEFNFPPELFSQTPLTNPGERYQQIQDYKLTPNDFIEDAADHGSLELVEFLVKAGATKLDDALIEAVEHGHLNIVKYLIDVGADNYDSALEWAARFGQLDIVKFLVQNTPAHVGLGLDPAVDRGHLDVVRYLVDQAGYNLSPDSLDEMLLIAVRAGHLEIAQFLVDQGATDLDDALQAASANNRLVIVRWLRSIGADNLKTALRAAIHRGHLEMVRELLASRHKDEEPNLELYATLASGWGQNQIENYIHSLMNK
jgi:ankyrin repeat protein